jgi:hypothetical protein
MSAPEPASGHDGREISVRAALLFGAALLAMVLLSLVLVKWTFDLFAGQERRAQIPPASLLRSQETAAPPTPAFLMYPARNLQETRAAEDAILNSYGWVDRSGGVARIPIRRAMELLLLQGLPVRAQTPPPPPAGGTP